MALKNSINRDVTPHLNFAPSKLLFTIYYYYYYYVLSFKSLFISNFIFFKKSYFFFSFLTLLLILSILNPRCFQPFLYTPDTHITYLLTLLLRDFSKFNIVLNGKWLEYWATLEISHVPKVWNRWYICSSTFLFVKCHRLRGNCNFIQIIGERKSNGASSTLNEKLQKYSVNSKLGRIWHKIIKYCWSRLMWSLRARPKVITFTEW